MDAGGAGGTAPDVRDAQAAVEIACERLLQTGQSTARVNVSAAVSEFQTPDARRLPTARGPQRR